VNSDGTPILNRRIAPRVIYLIRNPLDVVVSFSHFSGKRIDQIIDMLASDKAGLCQKPDRLYPQLQQQLRSWTNHVLSWVDHSGLNVEILRYEDMKRSPYQTFTKAVRFIGLQKGPEEIRKAISFSDFSILRKQEKEEGFREKGSGDLFFRRGEVGGWRSELTEKQVLKIVTSHREVMERFGYIP
jgi:hypothetical protein